MLSWQQFVEKHGVVYDFSSVLAYLPKEEANKIIQWGKDHISEEDVYTDPKDPSYGRENEIHTTVLYGLHDTGLEKVEKILKPFKPFTIKINGISSFTNNEKFDVVKLEVESKELHDMHDALSTLPHTSSYPVYKPHITIAYVKKGKAKKYFGETVISKSKIDYVVFSSKKGWKKKIIL